MFIQTDAYRGKGGSRGGGRRGGGRRGGSGRHGRSAGRARSAARSAPNRGTPRKGVYRSYSSGRRNNANTRTIRNISGPSNPRTAQAYGPFRTGGFGQPGTGRGSFFVGGNKFNRGVNRGGGRRFGGGGGSFRAPAMSPAPTPPGDGGDDTPTTPPSSGQERSVRVRNSPARRTAFGRGRRAQGSRRSLRIGQSLGGIALGGGTSRSGINV